MRKRISLILCIIAVAAASQAAETFKVGPFTFTVPEGWTKVQPASPMRNAQLEVAQGTAKAEITFFHFGGGSGTATDNVTRWFGQFSGSEEKRKTENTEAGGVKITFATAQGTFSSGMPSGPNTPIPGHGLCGAILAHDSGDVYVKMTGPEALVNSACAALRQMVMEAAKTATPKT